MFTPRGGCSCIIARHSMHIIHVVHLPHVNLYTVAQPLLQPWNVSYNFLSIPLNVFFLYII